MLNVSGNPSKFEYKCDLCNRLFNQKSKLTKHLASKTPCHEKRDLAWMKAQFSTGHINNIIDIFDTEESALMGEITKLTSTSSNEDLDNIRLSIGRLKRKKDSIVAYARISTHNDPAQHGMVQSEIVKLDQRINDIIRKYKLLLLV